MVSVNARDVRRITVDEYYQMADSGVFDDERVELLEGVLFSMNSQKTPHTHATSFLTRYLCTTLPMHLVVRVQMPLTLDNHSEPEPDLAVVTQESVVASEPYHPSTALLVIEVSDSTVRKDRGKGALYAAAGVPEYWLVNVRERCVEVLRTPSGRAYTHHLSLIHI